MDTGGAGDTFAGALLASAGAGLSLEKSVCYATVCLGHLRHTHLRLCRNGEGAYRCPV
ncbi:MAG: hypothetical protein ACLRR6_09085 [Oscillospiraceae bacterium]